MYQDDHEDFLFPICNDKYVCVGYGGQNGLSEGRGKSVLLVFSIPELPVN